MHRLTFFFICLMVFVMPAQEELTIDRFESGARLIGYVALACAPVCGPGPWELAAVDSHSGFSHAVLGMVHGNDGLDDR